MKTRQADDTRAVVYVRVSTKEQDQYSPEVQLDNCHAYAKDKGFRIVKEFREAASGWKANARVEFYQMLEFIEKEKIRNLIYAYGDRLSRNTEDYVKLKATKVMLHETSSGRSFNPSDPEDYEQTAAFEHDQVESKKSSAKNSKKVREGYDKRVQQGIWPHSLPLGLRRLREDEAGNKMNRIVPDPYRDRGPLIQQLFRLFATGTYTGKAIAEKMSELGLKSRSGKIPTKSQIEHYLKDPKYAGRRFRWEGELHDWHEDVTPLISQALFDEVQAVFEAKSRPISRGGPDYKYKSLFTCGLCNLHYIEENHERHYYRCSYQNQSCNKLGSPRFKESELDLLMETAIGMIDFEPGVYEWMKEEVEETFRLNRETEAIEKKRLEAELKSLIEERARAFQGFTRGITADESFVREEINRLNERMVAIEARLKELDTAEEAIIKNSLDTLGILNDFKNQYFSANLEKRRRMHFLMIRKISVHPLKQSKKELLADPKRALLLGQYPMEIEWKEPFAWLFEGKFIRELGRLADETMKEEIMLRWMKKPPYPAENEIERA